MAHPRMPSMDGDGGADDVRMQQEELKRQMMTQILDSDAHERRMYSLTCSLT